MSQVSEDLRVKLKKYQQVEEQAQELRNKASELRIENIDLKKEIEEKFSPRFLLGQELVVTPAKAYANSTSKELEEFDANVAFNRFKEGQFYFDVWRCRNYRQEHRGRKIKVNSVTLARIEFTKSAITLVWCFGGLVAKKDGTFGNLVLFADVIDKVETTD